MPRARARDRIAGSPSRRSIAERSATGSPGRHEQAGDAVLDGVAKAADPGRDHRSAVRHRLAGDDAVALASRRHADDGGALVVRRRPDRAARSPTASGTRSRSGPSPTITRGSPSVASRNSRIPFSSLRRPTKSTCGGSSGSADLGRDVDAVRDDAHVSRAEPRAAVGEERRRGDHDPGPADERAHEPRDAPARARRRCPRPAARTACGSRARGAPRESSARGRRRPPARRAGRRARTRRGRAAAAGRATARPGGSARSRRRRRSRSGGSRPARRRRPRPPRRADASTASATNAAGRLPGVRGYDVVRTQTRT